MKIILNCSLCGYREWGTSDGKLMNKIKMLNHAKVAHPAQIERVLEYSVPKESLATILRSA